MDPLVAPQMNRRPMIQGATNRLQEDNLCIWLYLPAFILLDVTKTVVCKTI